MYYGCAIIIPRGFLFLVVSDYFCSFFFFSYLKVNAVCRMGVLPVLIVNTGVDDSWCRGVGESWWELSCTLFSAP